MGRERERDGEGERTGRGGEEKEGKGTRPHPFTLPLIHISGYAPVNRYNFIINKQTRIKELIIWK